MAFRIPIGRGQWFPGVLCMATGLLMLLFAVVFDSHGVNQALIPTLPFDTANDTS